MTMLQILPPLAYAGAALIMMWVALGSRGGPATWGLVAGAGVGFALFTGVTLGAEGLMQFWVNHSATYTGNQVWFDLLIAVTISFHLMAPRARAVGMALVPWAIAVILTASVALLPMLARLWWLEAQRPRQ
jgi:hypothetical protein